MQRMFPAEGAVTRPVSATLCTFAKSQGSHPYQRHLAIVGLIKGHQAERNTPPHRIPSFRLAARESGDTPSARWGLPAWEREGAPGYPRHEWR